MNTEIRDQWVAALESGEYRQGYQALATVRFGVIEYCCLGVLCELAVKAGVIPEPTIDEDNNKQYGAEKGTGLLPEEVIKWSEMEGESPTLVYDNGDGEETHSADYWNDCGGMSFEDIAGMVRNQL